MEKKFNKIQIAAIKRTAQNVSQFTTKKEKIDAKIAELEAEKKSLQPMIDAFQGPIKEMTGGYTTEDLVIREVIKTGKFDAKGKEILQVKWSLKYPETVVPIEVPMTEAGNDYDKDKEEMPEEEFQARVEQEEGMLADDPWA